MAQVNQANCRVTEWKIVLVVSYGLKNQALKTSCTHIIE